MSTTVKPGDHSSSFVVRVLISKALSSVTGCKKDRPADSSPQIGRFKVRTPTHGKPLPRYPSPDLPDTRKEIKTALAARYRFTDPVRGIADGLGLAFQVPSLQVGRAKPGRDRSNTAFQESKLCTALERRTGLRGLQYNPRATLKEEYFGLQYDAMETH